MAEIKGKRKVFFTKSTDEMGKVEIGASPKLLSKKERQAHPKVASNYQPNDKW